MLSIIEQVGLKIDQWLVKVQEAINVSELHVTAIGNGNAILKLQVAPTNLYSTEVINHCDIAFISQL